MRKVKHEAFNEVNSIPEIRSEEVPKLRNAFNTTHGRNTTLSDDDIVNILASDVEGDCTEEDYVSQMLDTEKLPELASAE